MPKALKVEYQGQQLTLKEISARCGIPSETLRLRLFSYGQSVERATTKSVSKRARNGGRPAAKKMGRPERGRNEAMPDR
jgi:hypothetical protein